MSGRGGYSVVAYCIDVSPSMAEPMADPDGTGIKRPKLAWVKEYVAREFEPKVSPPEETQADSCPDPKWKEDGLHRPCHFRRQ